jgi:hypothetical protein
MSNQEKPRTDEILSGPRKTGIVELAAGNLAVHEVTSDGMKQTRIVGNGESYAQWDARIKADKAQFDEFLKATDRSDDPEYQKQWMSPEQRAALEATEAAQATEQNLPTQQ